MMRYLINEEYQIDSFWIVHIYQIIVYYFDEQNAEEYQITLQIVDLNLIAECYFVELTVQVYSIVVFQMNINIVDLHLIAFLGG